MDIKELNKTQVVLLCLLIAFVSSIATGITVVRLMVDQVASTTDQPVNRVIRQTIEKIITPNIQPTTPATTEEVALIRAIEKASAYVVTIQKVTPTETDTPFFGTIINGTTVIVDGARIIDATPYNMTIGNTTIPLTFIRTTENHLSYFSFTDSASTKNPPFTQTALPKIGQTAFAFNGPPLSLVKGTVLEVGTEAKPHIVTTIDSKAFFSGTPILDSAGAIIGIGTITENDVTIVPIGQVIQAATASGTIKP